MLRGVTTGASATNGTRSDRAARRRPALIDGALVVAGVIVLALLPRDWGGDGEVRYRATRELASGDLPELNYSLVQPLLAVPLEWLGRLLDAPLGITYRFNVVVFAVGVAVTWALLRRVAPTALTSTFLLLLVYASMFPAHVVSFYGETLTAVLLACGLLTVTVCTSASARAGGWAAAVVGVVNTPAALPALALAAILVAVRRRTAVPLLVVPAAIGLVLLDIRLRLGELADPYEGNRGTETILPYSGLPGFSYPALLGVLVIVFSFGKGLLFFAPGLFLPVRDRLAHVPALARARLLWIVVVIGLVLVYCRWWAWYGGVYWGPRFFLFASIPAALAISARLAAPARSLAAEAVTLAALLVSAWVAVSASFGNVGLEVCTRDDYALEFLCWYAPEFSVLWHPFVEWPALSAAQWVYATLALAVFVRLSVPHLRRAVPLASGTLARARARWREGDRWYDDGAPAPTDAGTRDSV
jgi:hypothetical protein